MNVMRMLVVGLVLGTTVQAWGEGEDIEEALTRPSWEIGPEVSYFRYKEPGVMTEKGPLYGVAGAYTHYNGDDLFRLEGALSFGLIDYDGSLQDGTPYQMHNNHDYLFGLRGLWGREWGENGWDSRFTIGVGYRGLNDDSTQDQYGYDRQSNYLYLPVGLKICRELGGRWQVGLGGEVDVLLVGVQISDIDGGVTNVQWPGFGGRATVELRHAGPPLDVALAPFVQYWWVDESNVSRGWYEPRNNSLQYGLGLIFRF